MALNNAALIEQAEIKRQKAYEAYLRGTPQYEIARELHVTQGRVSQYLQTMRERGMAWYETHADPKLRRKNLHKEMADRYEDVWREQWKLAEKPEPTKTDHFRAFMLAGITRTLDSYRQMIGLVEPSLDQAWIQDQMRKIDEATRQLEKDRVQGPEVAYSKWANAKSAT